MTMIEQIKAFIDELAILQNIIASLDARLTILERKPTAIDVPALAAQQRVRECRSCGAGHGCGCARE